jgi:hypothetical protein
VGLEGAPLLTAGHGPVDRPLGRPGPRRDGPPALQLSIVDRCVTPAPELQLWPCETHPRSWRYNGNVRAKAGLNRGILDAEDLRNKMKAEV